MTGSDFRCAACGKIFEKAWTDEEAAAELAESFTGFEPSDCAIVCEDCYQEMVASSPAAGRSAGFDLGILLDMNAQPGICEIRLMDRPTVIEPRFFDLKRPRHHPVSPFESLRHARRNPKGKRRDR